MRSTCGVLLRAGCVFSHCGLEPEHLDDHAEVHRLANGREIRRKARRATAEEEAWLGSLVRDAGVVR